MEKCRCLYQFSWCHFGEMTQCWWERVSFCWCACEEKVRKRLMLSGLVHAPPRQHRMLNPSALDVPLCPSHSALPSAPAGQHTWCAQNNRLAWLFQFRNNRLQYSSVSPPCHYPQAALVNVNCLCYYYSCHFLTLLFAALVPLFSAPISFLINNPPLIAFFPTLISFFPHPSQPCKPGLRWQDGSCWPCVTVFPSMSSALPFPCLWHLSISCQAPLHPSLKSLKLG